LNHDDGITNNGLEEAQVILIGVSRCGKTPTSLYLAMQYSIKAANYPLIPEDFARGTLPAALIPHRHKIFGLSIQPERLHSVRTERRPDSLYASLENCRKEIATAERMMKNAGITWTDSSTRSIEELSAIILQKIRQPAK
jgi:regulator of PEP synthase PpsR (kinase-PPPase family)